MGPERSSHPCWNHPGNTAGSLSRLKAGGQLPEHRNFLLLIWPMRLLARRRGLAQRAPLVSMGLERRKSASHLRLQSQMKGFWARCLSRGGRLGMKDKAAHLCWWPPGWGLASSWRGPPGPDGEMHLLGIPPGGAHPLPEPHSGARPPSPWTFQLSLQAPLCPLSFYSRVPPSVL